MKRKIFNLILAFVLIIAVLVGLTACGDEESKSKKDDVDTSSAKGAIESAIDAINNQDAKALVNLIDFKALENTYGEDIDKKEFKSALKDFFDEYDDLEIKASKIQKLEEDDELLESLLESYDSYDEYVEEIEDEYDIDNLLVYTAKIKVSEEYEDLFEDSAIVEGKDVIYLTEDDDEYKIIYSMFSIRLYSDYIDEYDVDYDYDYDYEVNEDALEYLEEYEGKQTGKTVKEILDYIVENTSYEYSLYANYYDKDGISDGFMLNTDSEISALKKKLDNTHKYTIEIDPTDYGYCNVDITY